MTPMKKCRRCTKTASIHITEIREGKATAVHLCESCAREYLEKGAPADSSNGLESDDVTAATETQAVKSDLPPCRHCGISFEEFREHGRFGCPHDYTHFQKELQPLLENIHEDTQHVGKQPRRLLIGTADQTRLVQLRSLQRDAIEEEEYETAAQLRDEIAALELQLRQSTGPRN
jgi:protein arginine kinase activator